MPTVRQLFPEMPSKTRQKLGELIKENKIEAIGKVEVIHHENDYSEDDIKSIVYLAASLIKKDGE